MGAAQLRDAGEAVDAERGAEIAVDMGEDAQDGGGGAGGFGFAGRAGAIMHRHDGGIGGGRGEAGRQVGAEQRQAAGGEPIDGIGTGADDRAVGIDDGAGDAQRLAAIERDPKILPAIARRQPVAIAVREGEQHGVAGAEGVVRTFEIEFAAAGYGVLDQGERLRAALQPLP